MRIGDKPTRLGQTMISSKHDDVVRKLRANLWTVCGKKNHGYCVYYPLAMVALFVRSSPKSTSSYGMPIPNQPGFHPIPIDFTPTATCIANIKQTPTKRQRRNGRGWMAAPLAVCDNIADGRFRLFPRFLPAFSIGS